MQSDPWLAIIGLGEDGPAGLSDASRAALARAEVIFGGPRHLALVEAGARGRNWPVPFTIDPVLAEKGRKLVVLASGDPFWFGAGGSLARALSPGEWVCHPAPSTFSHAAARLGWRLEEAHCFGLHAAPFGLLLPVLTRGQRILCLMRDGEAVGQLATWLTARGFGASGLTVLEALGGPSERLRQARAESFDLADVAHPVALAIAVEGPKGLPRAAGLADDLFASDGVMTKRPIRALTLSALAPRAGEVLWDLGAGSGSVSVEWCLAAPGTRAHAVEARADRTANLRANAEAFGLPHRLKVVEGDWAKALSDLPAPDAVFIGGGADQAGLETVWATIPPGTRLVINAVTIESEMLLADWHRRLGGDLFRYDVAQALPLGRMLGWAP
ncbi:MAG: precorrin-6y C5,15-methyltransferase (decarboxylating) subunit CbiE, partial [Rhodobacteraceae bacterium]|nr:precorrin-6y C5,15-methyltransferase (decarboxylating) subunit CbiE [Paracoccaceae bacterium]